MSCYDSIMSEYRKCVPPPSKNRKFELIPSNSSEEDQREADSVVEFYRTGTVPAQRLEEPPQSQWSDVGGFVAGSLFVGFMIYLIDKRKS